MQKKYLDRALDLYEVWIMMETMIPAVVGVYKTFFKCLQKSLNRANTKAVEESIL